MHGGDGPSGTQVQERDVHSRPERGIPAYPDQVPARGIRTAGDGTKGNFVESRATVMLLNQKLGIFMGYPMA